MIVGLKALTIITTVSWVTAGLGRNTKAEQ